MEVQNFENLALYRYFIENLSIGLDESSQGEVFQHPNISTKASYSRDEEKKQLALTLSLKLPKGGCFPIYYEITLVAIFTGVDEQISENALVPHCLSLMLGVIREILCQLSSRLPIEPAYVFPLNLVKFEGVRLMK